MLGIDQEQVRIITPDVGGAFGAKFGADPEHALVCWVARRLGRPARWTETRNENLVGMTHGRAQRQTVTIGGSRDGTVAAYRLEILQDSGAYPTFGAFLPSLTILMAPGPVRDPEGRGGRDVGGDQHHAGRRLPRRGAAGGDRRGRAGHGPVRRRDRHGPGRGAAQEPAAAVHRAAHDRVRRHVRQRRLRGRAGQGAGRGRATRSCGRSRPSGGPPGTWSSWASACPATWRSPGRRARRAARARTPRSRCIPTAAPPS